MMMLRNANDSAMSSLDISKAVRFQFGERGKQGDKKLLAKRGNKTTKKLLGKGGNKKTKILPQPVLRAAAAYGRQLKIRLVLLTIDIFILWVWRFDLFKRLFKQF